MSPNFGPAEIASRLDETPAPDSPNRISERELREWAVKYLGEYDEELRRFPDLVGQAHWDLWMVDARHEDALFAVLIFRNDGVEFFCGTGNAYDVREFAESQNPEELLGMMSASFSIPGESVRLSRSEAEQWLGPCWRAE
jgi:hypothetical protein